jgi:hypothetical protein
MAEHPVDEFGFKRITPEDWLSCDPAWNVFAVSNDVLDQSEAWLRTLLKISLDSSVPIAIRKLFEVARGTLVYGSMFYPLLTIGTEQIFRVFETAASHKCKAMNAPPKIKVFAAKIDWLAESGAVSSLDRSRWDAIRQLRNSASHPKDQYIYDPNITLNVLDGMVELVNRLFSP